MEAVSQIKEIIAGIKERVEQTRTAYEAARAEYAAALAALKPSRKRKEKPAPADGPVQITRGKLAGQWRNPGSRLAWPTKEAADEARGRANG